MKIKYSKNKNKTKNNIKYIFKLSSYAFLSYDNNDSAIKALNNLQGTVINGYRCNIEVSKASRNNKRLRMDQEIIINNNGKNIILSKKQMILLSDTNNNLNEEHLMLLCNNFGNVLDIFSSSNQTNDDSMNKNTK